MQQYVLQSYITKSKYVKSYNIFLKNWSLIPVPKFVAETTQNNRDI